MSAGARAALQIWPLTGIGEVHPGDDLAGLIADAAGDRLRDGDVLVVTSKIVSKAEGRLVDLPPGDDDARAAARQDALAAETARVVAQRGPVRIVQTQHGFVMAAAGIDASNVAPSQLVLLPKDPDASARALRGELRERFGVRVAVIVSDTMGRAWRTGQTDVALGAAGIPPVRDHRGQVDPYGNELQVTEIAVVDELAGAAELVKGKFDGLPVAVVRGYPGLTGHEPDGPGVAALIRPPTEDLFSLGTAEAHAAGLRAAATLPERAPSPDRSEPATGVSGAVAAAVATVTSALAPGTTLRHTAVDGRHEITIRTVPGRAPEARTAALVRLGADLHRLRAALAAEGLTSALVNRADVSVVDRADVSVVDQADVGVVDQADVGVQVRISWAVPD